MKWSRFRRWPSTARLLLWNFAVLALCSSPTRATAQDQSPEGLRLHTRAGVVMGTRFELSAWTARGFDVEQAFDAAEAELRRVEDLMTTWRDSPLLRMNARSGEGPVEVPRELARMIDQSLRIARATDGAFDPTWHSVGRLWDFKADPPRIPAESLLEALLERVDWRRVKVDLGASTVELPTGVSVGLGGIAKGYGVDRALEVLRAGGVQHALVDAGGDLRTLGLNGDKPWEIAIRHPRQRDRVLAVVPVSNLCVLTSGDYERFFELDGVRYHHILDPRTGRPATGCMSATVIGPEASLCDALATALCVMGPERGLALIETLDSVEALVVGLDGAVVKSSGL